MFTCSSSSITSQTLKLSLCVFVVFLVGCPDYSRLREPPDYTTMTDSGQEFNPEFSDKSDDSQPGLQRYQRGTTAQDWATWSLYGALVLAILLVTVIALHQRFATSPQEVEAGKETAPKDSGNALMQDPNPSDDAVDLGESSGSESAESDSQLDLASPTSSGTDDQDELDFEDSMLSFEDSRLDIEDSEIDFASSSLKLQEDVSNEVVSADRRLAGDTDDIPADDAPSIDRKDVDIDSGPSTDFLLAGEGTLSKLAQEFAQDESQEVATQEAVTTNTKDSETMVTPLNKSTPSGQPALVSRQELETLQAKVVKLESKVGTLRSARNVAHTENKTLRAKLTEKIEIIQKLQACRSSVDMAKFDDMSPDDLRTALLEANQANAAMKEKLEQLEELNSRLRAKLREKMNIITKMSQDK